MGALLLSGIRPSPRWMDVPPTEGHRDDTPVSHKELFIELLSSLKVPERGLDNERILSKSHRFKSVENILLFWDHVCSVHADYLRISDEGDRPFRDRDRRFRQRDRSFRQRDRANCTAELALRMTSTMRVMLAGFGRRDDARAPDEHAHDQGRFTT
jgi:hypothetical protein